jgi:predicted N-formylglutamate amidohydrolase
MAGSAFRKAPFDRHIAYDIGVEAVTPNWPLGLACRPCSAAFRGC